MRAPCFDLPKEKELTVIQGNPPDTLLLTPDLGFLTSRNSRTFPIEILAHDSGRTLVRAEYGYPKGSPNTNS
jgi:hypothetical protein